MNKFKKILLGTLSVLTLGLFVSTGAKVSAIEYSETHDYAWEASDFYDTAATGVKGGSFEACAYGIISFGNSGYNVGTYSGVTNDTGETLGEFALIPSSGGRTMTFAIPSGQTKVSITMFVANINKNASNGSYPAATSNNRDITFSGSYSNLKYDGTSVSSVTVGYDAKVHIITFDYTGSTTLTTAQNASFLGAYGDNVTTDGYNVTYVSEHGTTPSQLTEQTTLPATLPSMSATGYTFGGWYTDSNCTDGNEAVAGAALSGNVTLYAKWTVNAAEWCAVTFDANGGSSVANVSAPFGSTITLPNSTKTGYYLSAWNDGTSNHEASYTLPNASAITLTAVWKDKMVFDETCTFSKKNNDNDAEVSNDLFVTAGSVNTNAGNTVTFNGETYSTPLKMQSGTELSFTLANDAFVYVVFVEAKGTCKIDEDSTKLTATNHVLKLDLAAGQHTIKKADTANIGFVGVAYKMSNNTSVTVEADKSTDGDTIRFMGTLAGITDVDNIDSIQLLLSKDGVKAKKEIYFTTVYRSVKGKYAAADNTYYVIFALKDVKDVIGTFNFDVKVSFTDDSFTVNEVQGTYVAE